MAAELRSFLADKLPLAGALDLPNRRSMAKMLRRDSADGGIDYLDENGEYAGFHALRPLAPRDVGHDVDGPDEAALLVRGRVHGHMEPLTLH